MIDDGVFPERAADEPDRDDVLGDAQLLLPDDFFGAPPPDLVLDLGEVKAGDSPASAISGSPIEALPEYIWSETTGFGGRAEPDLAAESELDGDWWLPGDQDNSVLVEPQFVEPLHDAHTADRAASFLPAQPGPGRPVLASAPLAASRWSALPRSFGAVRITQRVAGMALLAIVAAGLLVVMATRGANESPARGPRQIDAAGIRPTSTMPTSSVLRAPSTSVTTPPVADQGAPVPGGVPTTTSAPPSAPAGTIPTPTTATTARTPSGATVASSAPPAPTAPPPPPAPAPTPTVAPPITTPVTQPPEPLTDPETTATTRRPRPTVPETTLPSTTLPTSTSLPANPGN